MGRWSRKEFERVLFEKTVKLYDKVIDDVFGKAGDDMDLRLATFIRRLDPEDKCAQACFGSLVQQILWDKPGHPSGPRVTLDAHAEPDAYPPPEPDSREGRVSRFTRSPFPTTREQNGALWTSLLDDAALATETGPGTDHLGTSRRFLARSSATSRAHSPSARRRVVSSPPNRYAPLSPPRLNSLLRSPTPPSNGRSTWEFVNFHDTIGGGAAYLAGEVETAEANSPPRSPSQAWLNEYTASRPIAPRPVRGTGRPSRPLRHSIRAGTPPGLGMSRVRPREDDDDETSRLLHDAVTDERRAHVRRRTDVIVELDRLRNSMPPSSDEPTLRRSRSSWRDTVSRDALQGESGVGDSRRYGVVFEPFSPALPSLNISTSDDRAELEAAWPHGVDSSSIDDSISRQAERSRNLGLGVRGVDGVEQFMDPNWSHGYEETRET